MAGYNMEQKAGTTYTNLTYLDWFNDMINNIRIKEEELTPYEEKLLEHYKMILNVCGKYKPQIQNNEEFGDLIQEGLLILQLALDRYKPIVGGKKVKFSSYLFIMLNGYIQQAFNDKFRGIKLTQTAIRNEDTKYIDFLINGDNKRKCIEEYDCEEINEDFIDLRDRVSKLSPKEQLLIQMYFFDGYSYSKIGELINMSKQMVYKTIKGVIENV